MPPFNLPDKEMTPLVAFLRTLKPVHGLGLSKTTIHTTDGKTLEGLMLNQSSDDLQLQTADKRIHLLRKAGDTYREVTSQTDWPSYNGQAQRQSLQHARPDQSRAMSRAWRRSGSSRCPIPRRCR